MDTNHAAAVPEADEPNKPVFTAKLLLLWPTALATALIILWPAGDLTYRGSWDYPMPWKVLVIATLAGWIMVVHEQGAERSRQNQTLILEKLALIQADMESWHESVRNYGDVRESEGHKTAAAYRANGSSNGQVKHLHPVE